VGPNKQKKRGCREEERNTRSRRNRKELADGAEDKLRTRKVEDEAVGVKKKQMGKGNQCKGKELCAGVTKNGIKGWGRTKKKGGGGRVCQRRKGGWCQKKERRGLKEKT